MIETEFKFKAKITGKELKTAYKCLKKGLSIALKVAGGLAVIERIITILLQ
tara:strand:+ start:377 stop:529 length:153 start_codon:yes stop_codon:yes gene_type:complete